MPEFSEVNIQVRYLQERCQNWKIAGFGYEGWSHFQNVPEEGRDELLQEFFTDNEVVNATQRGKHVLIHTKKGILASHLMFKGRWSMGSEPFMSNYKNHKKPPTDKSCNFWMVGENGDRLNFHEPEYKGKVTIYPGITDAAQVEHLAKLGPEAMVYPETDPAFAENPWTFEAFQAKAGRSKQAIKAFLLDQKKQAGIGNVYVCEGLYAAKVDPSRPANSLSDGELQAIYECTLGIMKDAIDTNLDYESVIQIYRKKEDPNGNPVDEKKISGRGTFWVPAVQN